MYYSATNETAEKAEIQLVRGNRHKKPVQQKKSSINVRKL